MDYNEMILGFEGGSPLNIAIIEYHVFGVAHL